MNFPALHVVNVYVTVNALVSKLQSLTTAIPEGRVISCDCRFECGGAASPAPASTEELHLRLRADQGLHVQQHLRHAEPQLPASNEKSVLPHQRSHLVNDCEYIFFITSNLLLVHAIH